MTTCNQCDILPSDLSGFADPNAVDNRTVVCEGCGPTVVDPAGNCVSDACVLHNSETRQAAMNAYSEQLTELIDKAIKDRIVLIAIPDLLLSGGMNVRTTVFSSLDKEALISLQQSLNRSTTSLFDYVLNAATSKSNK